MIRRRASTNSSHRATVRRAVVGLVGPLAVAALVLVTGPAGATETGVQAGRNHAPATPGTPALDPATTAGTGPDGFYSRDDTPVLLATVSDPDGDNVRGRFQVLRGPRLVWEGWSGFVASGGTAQVTVGVTLVEGGPYTVRVRADDGTLTSPRWSPRIRFRVDVTPPAVATVVTPKPGEPAVYVEDGSAGGVGVRGAFTFTGGGVADVAHYRYSFNGTSLSEIAGLSGGPDGQSVDVVFLPTFAGPQSLLVVTVDRAGWTGPERLYRFNVNFPGVVGRWRLDEGTGDTAADSSGRGHPLTLVDTTWTTGVLADFGADPADRALRFDATGDGASTSDPVVATDRSFSVMAFVNLDSVGPTGTAVGPTGTAVGQDGLSASGFELGYAACGGQACWAFTMFDADSAGGAPVRALAPVPATAGGWVHLTGVYDAAAAQTRVYACVIGTPDDPGPAEPVIGTAPHTSTWSASGPLRLGRGPDQGADANHLVGVVDDVRVFDGAVSIGQIRDACLGGG
jgi:hypothetical protein